MAKKRYVLYHKFGGYVTPNNEYTDDVEQAWSFDTREDAEIEIGGYLEHVEEISST